MKFYEVSSDLREKFHVLINNPRSCQILISDPGQKRPSNSTKPILIILLSWGKLCQRLQGPLSFSRRIFQNLRAIIALSKCPSNKYQKVIIDMVRSAVVLPLQAQQGVLINNFISLSEQNTVFRNSCFPNQKAMSDM